MFDKFRFVWDEATFMEGAKLAYDYDMRHTWRRYVGWFFIAMTQFGVVGAINHGAPGLLLVSTILVVYWYFLRWPLRKRALRRFFEKSPLKDQEIVVEPEEGGICLAGSCVPWREFVRVVASERGYLLDMVDGFLYIPRKVFADSESRNAFVAVLKAHIPNFVRF